MLDLVSVGGLGFEGFWLRSGIRGRKFGYRILEKKREERREDTCFR
jgi:hypothetical protein